jgi:hypothetical protein
MLGDWFNRVEVPHELFSTKRSIPRTAQKSAIRDSFSRAADVPGGVPINCIISDLSASGAKLTIRDQAAIPNEFALVFRRNCRIVHRFDGQIGVQFV